jgi:hypothetical protein
MLLKKMTAIGILKFKKHLHVRFSSTKTQQATQKDDSDRNSETYGTLHVRFSSTKTQQTSGRTGSLGNVEAYEDRSFVMFHFPRFTLVSVSSVNVP